MLCFRVGSLGAVVFGPPSQSAFRTTGHAGNSGIKWYTPRISPPESRAAVAAEKLRAGKDYDRVPDHPPRGVDIEQELRKYILRQFLVFVREASKLGKRGIWHVDRVENFALEFLHRATIDAVYDKGRGCGKSWISHWNGSLTSVISRQFEGSSEWQQYQDMLLQVAEGQEAGAANADAKALAEPERRRSYRAEVRQWMARENVENGGGGGKTPGDLREHAQIDHVCSRCAPVQCGDPESNSWNRRRHAPIVFQLTSPYARSPLLTFAHRLRI
jgi:hypothetical protein